jgi:hypothetical protein
MARPLADRFWAKVEKTPGCWLWIGQLTRKGYGSIWESSRREGGRIVAAHRVSWEIHFGPIPDGLFVCHDCDKNYPRGDKTYRRCVNPTHLFLGTPAVNSADMVAKLRSASGERHGRAKLTWEEVQAIRAMHSQGFLQRAMADRFGVTRSVVSRIVTRRIWTK